MEGTDGHRHTGWPFYGSFDFYDLWCSQTVVIVHYVVYKLFISVCLPPLAGIILQYRDDDNYDHDSNRQLKLEATDTSMV